jgi:hypothetical protein
MSIEDLKGTLETLSTEELLEKESRVGDNPHSLTSEIVLKYYNLIIEQLNSRGIFLEDIDK